ncbi:MAG: glycosyltransferase [Candidatus Anstonellales archaeon]
MKLISYIGDHPVYYSIYRALETIGFNIDRLDKVLYNIDLGNSYIAIRDIRRDYIFHLSHSFLINPRSLELLFKNRVVLYMEESWNKNRVIDKIYENLFKVVYKHPKAILITSTMRSSRYFQSLGLDNLHIPPAREEVGNSRRLYITTIARAHPIKRLELVFRIADILKDEDFVIITKPSSDQRYFRHILNMSKEYDNVKLVVDPDEDTKFNLLKNSKILLHPADRGPIEYVIVEGLSAHLPCVCYRNIGLADELPEEWIVQEDTLENWVNIIRSISDSDYRIAREIFRDRFNIDGEYYKNRLKELKIRLEPFLV